MIEENVRIGDLRLRVCVSGAASGPPVVLLHGGGLMGST
jgi:hypothetical protein